MILARYRFVPHGFHGLSILAFFCLRPFFSPWGLIANSGMSASFPSRSGSWCWAAPIACGTSCAACARNPEDGAATRRGKLQAAGHQDMVDAGFFPGRALCGKPGPAVEPFGAALGVQLHLAVAACTRGLQQRVQ